MKNEEISKEIKKDDWEIPNGWDSVELRAALDKWQAVRKVKTEKSTTSVIFKHFDSAEHLLYAAEVCTAGKYQGIKPDYRKSGTSKTNGKPKPAEIDPGLQAILDIDPKDL